MKKIAIALVVSLIASCASQTKLMNEYKEITQDINVKNPTEVKLAQILYTEMILKNK